jgi:transposase
MNIKKGVALVTRPNETCRNREWLYHQYITLRKNAPEVAKEAGTTQGTVLRWLERHGIPIRDIYECQVSDDKKTGQLKDAVLMRKWYEIEGKTAKEIALQVGVGVTTVLSWLERHGIERRDYHETMVLKNPKVGLLDDETWMEEQYVNLRRSAKSIAKEIGVRDSDVRRHLKKHGFAVRNISQSKISEGILEKVNDGDYLSSLYQSGMTVPEIAHEIGCSQQTVYRRLETLGFFAVRKRNVRAWENECFRVFADVIGERWIGHETFPWLKMPNSRQYMHIDMFIPSLSLCIEFDGAGHFKPIQYGKGMDKDAEFAKTKARDAFKDEIVPNHGLKLIRFPWYIPLTKESVRKWLIEHGVEINN